MPPDTTPAQPLINVRDLRVAFGSADQRLPIIDIPTWSMSTGALVVIEGPSGCGKSTFLNVLGGLLACDSGNVRVCGADLASLDEAGRDRWRADHVGVIFQGLNLLQGFSALDNVLLGATFSRTTVTAADARALLSEVGLAHRLYHRPSELSLGEQQRVAIARALIKRPQLILADEPTGSLDPKNAADITALLRRVCTDHGCSLIMVCHQPEIAAGFPARVDFTTLNRATAQLGVAP
ncbi:MAG: ABC transporter ATP-binding protein [Planctomycetota bacterium]